MTDKQIKKLNELTEISQELGLYEYKSVYPDKQIDINNQVEVGLNIAKELLELHKIFEDEVKKNPYVIQTDFIKSKLFYFYQRADWLNVCFKLLEQQLSRKEQELEELRQYHNKCCEENIKKEAEWLEKYNQVSRDFYNGKYCNKENCNLLKAKEQECERLKEGYSELTDIVNPYMGDFTGYNEELGGFDIVLCVKELMEQLDKLKAENEILEKDKTNLDVIIETLKVQFKQLEKENERLKEGSNEKV